ncbi:MAG: alpha/beta hydrolase [Balneolaceae bacterium]
MEWIKKFGLVIGWIFAGIAVFGVFVGMLWLTSGSLSGYPALILAIATFAGYAWFITSKDYSPLGKTLRFAPISLFLVIAFWAMIPLGPNELFDFPDLPEQETWDLDEGRFVTMTHKLPPDSIAPKEEAILFLHGGPGVFVRDFDRDFMNSFSDFGYEVFVYDQLGAGRSAIMDLENYSHQGNVDDMAEIIKRIDKPLILIGQSYGAGLVSSYLDKYGADDRIRKIVLTEPGPLPGSFPQKGAYFDDKTTSAPNIEGAGLFEVAQSPRFVLGMTLPIGNKFVNQIELMNHIDADLQRKMVATAYCAEDEDNLMEFTPLPANFMAGRIIRESFMVEKRPDLRTIGIPVMMLLGECSDLPRGYAIDYFEAYTIDRSHWIPRVGHVLWSNENGRNLTRESILSFLNEEEALLPNEPDFDSRFEFIEAGR